MNPRSHYDPTRRTGGTSAENARKSTFLTGQATGSTRSECQTVGRNISVFLTVGPSTRKKVVSIVRKRLFSCVICTRNTRDFSLFGTLLRPIKVKPRKSLLQRTISVCWSFRLLFLTRIRRNRSGTRLGRRLEALISKITAGFEGGAASLPPNATRLSG